MEEKAIKYNKDKEIKRVMFIDIAKGIAILLMIVGHAIKHGILRNTIFSFHLPLFIITSGLFYKEKTIKEDIIILMKKLLIPTFIVTFLIYMINNVYIKGFLDAFIESIKVIVTGWSYKAKIDYSFEGVNVVWFIYLLVGIRLLFRINKKIAKNNEIYLFILVIVEMFIGYILGAKGYWLPWSLDVAFLSVFFYYIGYVLNKYNLLEKIFSDYKILTLILIIWIIGIKYSWIELAIRRYPHGCFSLITATAGSIIILKISKIIEEKFKRCSKVLSFCGENSLYILFGHRIESCFINYNLAINGTLNLTILAFLKCFFSMIFALIILCLRRIKEELWKKYYQ